MTEERKKELLLIINGAGKDTHVKAIKLVDDIVFLEDKLEELRKLPFISVNPNNPMKQKTTPASKLYKEMLQQYNGCIRLLFRITGDLGEDGEESPLRKWCRSRKGFDVDG